MASTGALEGGTENGKEGGHLEKQDKNVVCVGGARSAVEEMENAGDGVTAAEERNADEI